MENERAGDISRRILSPWTSRFGRSSTSAGRNSSINPLNLCALCLSAPLREAKRQRERRRTASGNRCKEVVAVVGGSGRWKGEGRLRRGISRRGAERQRAQRGRSRRRRRTGEPATSQDVSCRHESPAWIACQPHAPLNPMNLCALCLSAPLREAKTTTTRETTNPLPSQPHDPLSTQSISALSASPRLCVRQKRQRRETPGSGAAADASSIWYNVDGSSEQPSTAEHQAGDRKLKLQDVKETKR